MNLTLLTPFRPNRAGYGNQYQMTQDDNGLWHNGDISGETNENIMGQDLIIRCLSSLNKNSYFKHKIILVYEPDVIFSEVYKDKIRNKFNIEFFKSSKKQSLFHSMREALLLIPDDTIMCYNYNIDLVCGKNWDKYVSDARSIHGDDKVYTPIWVEPRQKMTNAHMPNCGEKYKDLSYNEETTLDSIWNVWRKLNCHSLTMKFPIDKDYITEKELDDWSNICNQFDKKTIIEPCGVRDYGYYNAMIANSTIFKQASDSLLTTIGAPDLEFDNNLKRDKVVVTNSHLFHLHFKCELDNIEVEHEK
jgi:hypothetical protein